MKGNKLKSIKSIIAVVLLVSMLLSPLTVLAETSGSIDNSDTGGGTSQSSDSGGSSSTGSSGGQSSEKSGSSESNSGSSSDSSTGSSSTDNNDNSTGSTDKSTGSDGNAENKEAAEQMSSSALSSEDKGSQGIEEKGDSQANDESGSNSENSESKTESEETGKSEGNALENENEKTDDEPEGNLSEDNNMVAMDASSSGASKPGSNSGNNQDINNNFPKSDIPDEELLGNTYKVELEDPGDVTKDEDKDFTMKFTEIGLFNLTQVFISIPNEFKINSVEDPVASGGNTWKSSFSGQEIKLEADEVDPLGWFSDDRLIFGDWVSVTFNLTPEDEGTFTFDTEAEWTHHKYEKIGQIWIIPIFDWVRYDNPNSRHGDDPEVQVLAAAEEPNGSGNGNGNGTINGPGFTGGSGGGPGGGFPSTDFGALFEEPAEPESTEQALTIAPEEPLVSPGDYLVIPLEDPESELEPIIDVEFVLNGTNEDLLEALAAYEVLLAYFDEFWEEMSEEEYARHLIDLSAAWAAMQVLDASLQLEAGEEIDLEILAEAYELAMEHMGEHGEHLTAEQMEAATAVMEAVAELLDSLAEEEAA